MPKQNYSNEFIDKKKTAILLKDKFFEPVYMIKIQLNILYKTLI